MPTIRVIDDQGNETAIEDMAGLSVMEVLRNNGVDEVLALCDGCLSCATCHVYVDPAFEERLPGISADEDALLDALDHRRPTSRLSCQIPLTEDLDGLRLSVGPEE